MPHGILTEQNALNEKQPREFPGAFFYGFSLNLLIFFNTMPSYCPPPC